METRNGPQCSRITGERISAGVLLIDRALSAQQIAESFPA